MGPRSPADLDQARSRIESLAVTSLATDLYPGMSEAARVLQRGQSANKEVYLFSDMQKSGWEQQTGDLARSLRDIKDQATVFLVRCGTRKAANVAIIGITPQSGVPRPGERSGFGVLLRNTGADPVKNLSVSLRVDDNHNLVETQAVPLLNPGETRAVTLAVLLEKAGLRVLTARIDHDDLPGDNHLDQVIEVRERINVLVVDGGAQDRDPAKWSSFHLLNALQPVPEKAQARYPVQPRLVTPRLASPALLANADVCILVNVALQSNRARPTEVLPDDFVEALAPFVQRGKGLIVYAGDNVAADAYNRVLGKQQGLLPLPLKGFMEYAGRAALRFNPDSVGLPAFWRFRDDAYYKGFKDIEIYKAVELEEPAPQQRTEASPTETNNRKLDPLTIVFRYGNGKPAIAARVVANGEVVFITTSADKGWQLKSPEPAWTDWPVHFEFVPFVDVLFNHLLARQSQAYNIRAGEKLDWHPSLKGEWAYTLLHPNGTQVRLGLPENRNNRLVVTAAGLAEAGVYHMVPSLPPQSENSTADALPDKSAGAPIAVVPDLQETQDLTTLTDEEIDQRLGFRPIHMTAGAGVTINAGERLNREWTPWLLMAVLILAVGESVLAYWCGRAW